MAAADQFERRVVPLTDSAYETCERLANRYPAGPIYRNSADQPWDRHQIKDWFERLDGREQKPRAKAKSIKPRKQKAEGQKAKLPTFRLCNPPYLGNGSPGARR